MSRTMEEIDEAVNALWAMPDSLARHPYIPGLSDAAEVTPIDPAPQRPAPTLTLPQSFVPQEADRLLQELADLDDTWSAGAMLYGPGGLFDNARKSFLDVTAIKVRDEKEAKGEKITETHIDRLAHAHPDYIAFLDEHKRDRALWIALDCKRARINARLKIIAYGGRA